MRYLILLLVFSGAHAAGSGGVNTDDAQKRPYVILVSIDGLGNRVWEAAKTPTLDYIKSKGISAEGMKPVYPTLTFPNHYAIATGLVPAEHGIVSNQFPSADRLNWYSLYERETVEDGRWYEGKPIWAVAESNGMVAASYYFVGTEAVIDGFAPTYAYSFDPSVLGTKRVEQVLAWLAMPAEKRPHMITLYFEDVDVLSHTYGPTSGAARAAIERVDRYLDKLLTGVNALPHRNSVNIVVVSDHGQGTYLDKPVFVLDKHVPLENVDLIEGGAYLHLYFPQQDNERADAICEIVARHWKTGDCYTQSSAPVDWQITTDRRFPDVILIPDEGHGIVSSDDKSIKPGSGDHGWSRDAPSMLATFLAVGPNIPVGRNLGVIETTDVYPFLVRLLGYEDQLSPSYSSLIPVRNNPK